MELQAAEKAAEALLRETFDDSDNEDYNEEADKKYQQILMDAGKRKTRKRKKKTRKNFLKKVRKKRRRTKRRRTKRRRTKRRR